MIRFDGYLKVLLETCGSGGTGRHTILRGWRRKAWGFKSPLPHHRTYFLENLRGKDSETCMIILITIIHIIVCFFLIIVVLLQSGKSGDIAAAFGGMGSQTAFGPRGSATVLSKATTWSTVIFMLTSITLSIMASRGGSSSNSVLQGITPSQTKTQPAVPAKPPAPQK
jgi:preprotein translocase subunit SecG